MKAIAKLKPEQGLWWTENNPLPEIGPNDVLVKITKTVSYTHLTLPTKA